ncbi:23S rRNA (adenine(2030)-N(6))-methyltransferase RlmJ [Chelatococcus sp. SYSU_G07232]|uniref:Ribosomal RNA large subunit methyltransferase J n=1 Tax=Chelatococcus albus TaxID=3047466 RepID=A0ABT7AIS1_9HYPH|nr:23S rRNA (adenine(2030)-N(6))-methyltransferase RlmJ [Chelatococcus sp. SYSU_G07232]MDJ1159276.1 23S rRNA (adenine(2030)-N(6))-methyltransferase RlmJ [Chelatococcus sp. SYSU_G07232]
MNYRHAYHAGNFADVMKHALVARILAHLLKKETPFRVLDTHAGIGLYDLEAEEAGKTREWQGGIGLLESPLAMPAAETLIAPYRAAIAAVRERFGPMAYPGSPMLLWAMLRRDDRAIVVERHPVDSETLAELFARDRRIKPLALDGWTALHAMIPPKERRGLVLVDPPYEATGELERLGEELARAWRKWPTGIFVGWYPIKDAAPIQHFADALAARGLRKVLRLELLVDATDDPARLNGSGLVVINPPWTLKEEAEVLLPALAERLGRNGRGGFRSAWIAPE